MNFFSVSVTSPIYRPERIQHIKHILLLNNYPISFINNIYKNRLHKIYNSTRTPPKINNDNNPRYVALPYVNTLSEKINKILAPHNIKVAHQNHNNLRFLYTKLKDTTPTLQQTHIVYQIPCNNCNKVYIGQTQQHLSDRIKGHKYSNNLTALKKHSNNNNHSFNFNNTKILNKENRYNARIMLEMIQIKKHKNSVNDRQDITGLSNLYFPLI